ncbi:hypothetical protein FPQ18DRAFT_409239 [Pyronema domesticum]|nr:hypothetical protein FPQ18DRAFT_409239 [Pyronema domesticum]
MTSNSETVLTTFGITFRQIQIQSPLAAVILRMISCVDSQGVPHELLATLKGGPDEIILGEAIAKLRNFSLLQVKTDENEKSYSVHSLVYLAIQYSLSPEAKAAAVLDAAENLTTVIYVLASYSTLYDWKIGQKCFPPTMALFHFADPHLESYSLCTIYFKMACYCFETAAELHQETLSIRNTAFGTENRQTLFTMYQFACAYYGQRRVSEAIQTMEKVVTLRSRVIAEEHEDTKESRKRLAKRKEEECRSPEDGKVNDNQDISEFADKTEKEEEQAKS